MWCFEESGREFCDDAMYLSQEVDGVNNRFDNTRKKVLFEVLKYSTPNKVSTKHVPETLNKHTIVFFDHRNLIQFNNGYMIHPSASSSIDPVSVCV